MTESCVFKPTVRNKEGKEVNSRLFDNLLHFSSNDREFAKKYYFIGTNDEFLRTNARYVEYDENGEITFKSLKNLVSLDISSEKIINQLNKDISSGEHEYGEAVSLMTSFNNNSPYNDEYMATISTVEEGKANLQVVRRTTANQTALEETLTNKSLFDRIKQAVERVGGSIDFIDEDYSKYDTVNAKKAESGLYNVIFLSRKKFYRRNSGSMEEYTKEEQEILKNASRDSQGRLLAPNGKVSNLTEKQYAQVRTKAFKDWFGDWENNPSQASKVVDENGEPLVVYHGNRTNNSITVLIKIKKEVNIKKGLFLDFGLLLIKKLQKLNMLLNLKV